MLGSAEDLGLSLVVLSLVFAAAALIRRWSRPLRALFIPTAVIGGFLALALGPEGVGRFIGGNGIFSTATFAVWKALPGVLINVMCAALLLGERLPPLKTIWNISGSHVIMAGIMSGGQFAVASVLTLLVLEPVFGFSSKAGALIEMAFAGGHGTLAGLTPVLVEYDAEELLEVGLGLATIGMVTGIVVGTMLVNYGINSPSISVARQNPTVPDEDLDIDHHLPGPDDAPMDEWRGMTQVTAAAVFLGVSIAVGIALLEVFRWAFGLLGSNFFEMFPLFPFTIIGGVLVQLCAVRFDFEWAVNRRSVEGLGGLAIDGIVICAIGTLSLGRARRSHRSPAHPGPRVRGVERLPDAGHRPACLPAKLVRAFSCRVRRVPGQRRDRIRDGRHGRPVAPDRCRQGLQLSAAAHAARGRRRIHHRSGCAPHRCLGTPGLHDRDRGDHRGADGLGHAPGGSRTGRFPEPRTAGSQSLM